MYVISQLYKFETLSTGIFFIALVSSHLELRRFKTSYFERQQGNLRTYASRISVLSNLLVLMWFLGLATFYLSLAVIYGQFTYYFVWPTIILALISGISQCQIISLQRQVLQYNDNQITIE